MEDDILCVIPARGGSKGLPGKNKKHLNGKPLIFWTIDAAKKSKYLKKIVVSSDDKDILNIANQYGVTCVKRSAEFATDTALTVDVIKEVITKVEKTYSYILLLQCTSPLRTTVQIDEAIELLKDNVKKADAVISVKENEHPIQWLRKISEEGYLQNVFWGSVQDKQRQSYDATYLPNGAIYFIKTEVLEECNSFQPERTLPYIMDRRTSVDIDTAEDFRLAESILIGF